LEVGVVESGRVSFLNLQQAELRLTSLGCKGPEAKPQAKEPPPVPAKPVFKQPSASQELSSWADMVEEEEEAKSSGSAGVSVRPQLPRPSSPKGKGTAPAKQRSPSPKGKGAVHAKHEPAKKAVPPQPKADMGRRSVDRLRVPLAWLKENVQGGALRNAERILALSQKDYRLFLVSDESKGFSLFCENMVARFAGQRSRGSKSPNAPPHASSGAPLEPKVPKVPGGAGVTTELSSEVAAHESGQSTAQGTSREKGGEAILSKTEVRKE